MFFLVQNPNRIPECGWIHLSYLIRALPGQIERGVAALVQRDEHVRAVVPESDVYPGVLHFLRRRLHDCNAARRWAGGLTAPS